MVMLRAYSPRKRPSHCTTALAVLMVSLGFVSLTARGAQAEADALRASTSFEFVPADAAFYQTCLRNREQFDAVLQSNAMQRLLERPGMAKWLATLKARWQDPKRSLIGRWMAKSENRELANFAMDALSHEVFWYGDESFADVLGLTAYVNESAAAAQLETLRRGGSLADSERAAAYAALRIVASDPEELRIPPVVVGFRITDRERAERQIARLDELLDSLLDKPQKAERSQIAGNEFRTWRLSGAMLPWELVPKDELEKVDPQLQRRVRAVMNSKKATLSVGLRGDYLIVSLGEGNDHLTKLGQGPLLIDRPELAPVVEVADRPLNTIIYVGEAYRERAATADRHQFTGSFLVEEFIKHPEGLAKGNHTIDEQTRRELVADIKLLTAQFSDAARSRGATLRYSYLTPHGYEGRLYDWSQYSRLDGSQPLTLLNHLGGEPLGFFAMRRNWSVEDYGQWVHWLKRGDHYFQKIALPQMSRERQAAYVQMRRELEPQLARLDRATRELLIPAIADGQKAVVLDASPRSETIFVEQSEDGAEESPPDAFPGLELACVLGVSDPDKFSQACGEYLAVASETWNSVRGFIEKARVEADATTEAPRFRIPELPEGEALRPRRATTAQGEIFFYELPLRWRASDRIAPNMALSQDLAVMSWLPAYSQRLLSEQPLQLEGKIVTTEHPLAAAGHLNFAGMIDALQPWLERASERRLDRLAARAEARRKSPAPAAVESRTPRVQATQLPAPHAGQAASPARPQERTVSPRIPTPPPAPAAQNGLSRGPAAASLRVPQPPSTGAVASQPRETSPARTKNAPPPRIAPEEAKERLQFTLGLLRCIRSFTFATHQDENALITNYQIRIQDLEE